MRSRAKTVDEYVIELEHERREAIEKLRAMTHHILPNEAESMHFGMPTYRLGDGKYDFIALASQKQYMSLYVNPEVLAKHKSDLKGLEIGKSCVRFRSIDKLPMDVIQKILKESVK